MANYSNFNALEINLEDSPSGQISVSNQGATYEEAFLGGGSEEMSNARGKGRARRKKRKLERIANKREVRTERRKLRGDRQEERIARRKTRKEKRQEIRDAQMEARQERRNKRMEMKESRKGSPSDEEEDIDDPENDILDDDELDDAGSSSRDDDANDSSDTGASSSDEDEKADEYYGDDVDSGQDDAGYNDDSSYNQYPTFEEEDNFDGETSSFVSEVTGKKQIPAPIQQICLKIEWNNEMLDRLSRQKKKMKVDGVDTSRVDNAIEQKFERNQNLENQLDQFIGADGSKAKVVSNAKRRARAERIMKVIPPVVMARMLKKGLSKMQIKEWWQSRGAKKYSSMNGEQGWDAYPDVVYVDENINPFEYGMPTNEYDADLGGGSGFDPMSFANGEINDPMSFANGATTSGNNMLRSLIIGLVIGGVTIYVVRKYKLLS